MLKMQHISIVNYSLLAIFYCTCLIYNLIYKRLIRFSIKKRLNILKFLRILTLLVLSTSAVNAQSISDKELQERFNKAFSVFNQAPGNEKRTFSNMAKEDKQAHKEKEQEAISLQDKSEKNIVKKSNSIAITTQEQQPATEEVILPEFPKDNQYNAANFILLEQREVLIDMENVSLKQIVQEALNQVSHGEKWTIRWRLKDENKYLLTERINLTAEVSFDQFIGNMLNTITNITGIRLSTKVFNKNRIIIITDSF